MKILKVTNPTDSKSFTFYDNSNGVILREFEGFEYAEVRNVIEDISGEQSAIYITSKFGRRRISWQGDLVSDSVFTLRRTMLAALRQTAELKLIEFTTYDDLELRCEAEIVKVLNPYNHKVHTFLIEAVCPDWRFYSQAEHENNSDEATQIINNAGNEATDPTFRIYGPLTSVTINNLMTSESFTIELDEYSGLSEGEYIDVNVKEKTVKLDDDTSIYSDFDGEFFSLIPGNNTLQFSTVGGNGNTSLKTTWRDAYNGI